MAEPMPLPDHDYLTLPVPGGSDCTAIVKALAGVAGFGPRPDALGNMQAVYRIDSDGQGDYTLTYPAAARRASVRAVIDAATP